MSTGIAPIRSHHDTIASMRRPKSSRMRFASARRHDRRLDRLTLDDPWRGHHAIFVKGLVNALEQRGTQTILHDQLEQIRQQSARSVAILIPGEPSLKLVVASEDDEHVRPVFDPPQLLVHLFQCRPFLGEHIRDHWSTAELRVELPGDHLANREPVLIGLANRTRPADDRDVNFIVGGGGEFCRQFRKSVCPRQPDGAGGFDDREGEQRGRANSSRRAAAGV